MSKGVRSTYGTNEDEGQVGHGDRQCLWQVSQRPGLYVGERRKGSTKMKEGGSNTDKQGNRSWAYLG